jgi:hypothetical protein
MRKKRKAEEDFFVKKFMDYFRTAIDRNASELPEVTDKPDLAISSLGRLIGVEFSQLPSSYIISNFHKKMPTPTYIKDEIVGHLNIYPFEPHRWVHEVLHQKWAKAQNYKKRIKADEIWLVMHCHSTTKEWPMSARSKEGSRAAEALLMRFGTKQYQYSFARIFYIYADGAVVMLSGGSGIVPSSVSIPDGVGYPAVTTHQFSFQFDVPLPYLGVRSYQFDKIQFSEKIIRPFDEFMANRSPQIERPEFTARAVVDSNNAQWKVLRNGVSVLDEIFTTRDWIGKSMSLHILLEWSIQKTTFTYNA